MFQFLSRRFASAPVLPETPVRPEDRVYAVGDIHGRADLLVRLLERIGEDLAPFHGPATLVFLGDYVDRGDDSKTVLDLLVGFADRSPVTTVFLRGNHEEMLLDYLARPRADCGWLRHGGLETLASYGVSPKGEPEAVRDRLRDQMGGHVAFLEGLSLTYRSGNLLCVHAAAQPDLPANDQPRETVLWGSSEFHRRPRRDGVWVAHGHTIVSTPHCIEGRIAVDTGACYTGTLSAARIENGQIDFLTS